jgi:hypothetical protein
VCNSRRTPGRQPTATLNKRATAYTSILDEHNWL